MGGRRLLVGTVVVVALAAACGGDDDVGSADPSTSATSSAGRDPFGAEPLPASGAIPAGSYVAGDMGPRLRLDIPAGWTSTAVETGLFTLTSEDVSVTVVQRGELVGELLEMMTEGEAVSAGPVSETTLSGVPAKRSTPPRPAASSSTT